MYAKILKNYIFFIIKYVISILATFVATPIILDFVGESSYGVYLLLLEYLGYLIICDLGISMSSRAILNKAWGDADKIQTISLIKIIMKEMLKTFPLILIFLISIYIIIFEYTFPDLGKSEKISFLLMGATGFLSPLGILKEFLISSENSHVASKITMIQLFVMTLLNIAFVYMGFGITGLASSLLLSLILNYLMLVHSSVRIIGSMAIKNLPLNYTKKDLWSLNRHTFIQGLLGRLSYATDTIILSFFAPAAIITKFLLNQKLGRLSDTLVISLGNSAWASLANFKENLEAKQDFIDFINRLFLILATPLLFSLGLNNKRFLSVWIDNEVFLSDAFTLISFLNFLIMGVLSFWGWIFVSENKIRKVTKVYTISGIVNISLSIGLTFYFDELGPVLGTLISLYVVQLGMMSYTIKKEFRITMKDFYIRFFILLATYLLIVPFLSNLTFVYDNKWLELMINLICAYVILMPIALIIGGDRKDLSRFKNTWKRSD